VRTGADRAGKGARAVVASVAMALIAVGLVGLAAPASAAVSVTLSVSNGTVGVAQTVSSTVSTDALGAPTGTVIFTANGRPIGTQSVGGSLGTKAQVSWISSTAGSITVQAEFDAAGGEQAFDTSTVTIARVDSASSITTPGTAGANTSVPLTATVRSRVGQYVPTGTITFYLNSGSAIGSSGLDGSGRGSMNYTTPSTTGMVYVYAVYSGDASANASKTATDSIKVTATPSSVSLVVPQTNYVNTAVQLTAKINPAITGGTVDFSVNGKYLGTDKMNSGVASLMWVPNALGAFSMTAKFSGSGSVNGGSASNSVQVIQQLKQDQVTLNPVGTTGAWVPGQTTTMTNGSSVTFNVSSASGSTVTLGIAGPCSISGVVTLKVNGVGGPCSLAASTKGGNGYGPVSVKYTVQTAPGNQAAKVSAPASGSYKKGSKLTLAKTTTKTDVGQPVKWKVTKGGSYCKVITSKGHFKLSLVKKGACTVKGSAPAISNQWNAYTTARIYTVK
jgi:hypothetical protein